MLITVSYSPQLSTIQNPWAFQVNCTLFAEIMGEKVPKIGQKETFFKKVLKQGSLEGRQLCSKFFNGHDSRSKGVKVEWTKINYN